MVGLELQLVELVENKRRAEVQGRTEDSQAIEREIAAIHLELADVAERISGADEEEEPSARLSAPQAA